MQFYLGMFIYIFEIQHPSMSTPDYQRRSPRLIQKGHTVEELENQLLQKPTTISRPVTAEELERAMRGEVIEWSTPQLHKPTIPQYEQHVQVCVTTLKTIHICKYTLLL